jgi:regulator of PEP synthase PpsR (kinase-PPPase family)
LQDTLIELQKIIDQSATQRDLLKQVAELENELEVKKKQHEESEHELDKKALMDRVSLLNYIYLNLLNH